MPEFVKRLFFTAPVEKSLVSREAVELGDG
jgi:hypothetical protein